MDWLHCRLFAAKLYLFDLSIYSYAPVAQLDRAFDYESKGRAFESLRVHHSRNRTLGSSCQRNTYSKPTLL